MLNAACPNTIDIPSTSGCGTAASNFKSRRKRRVLVAEDDSAIRRMMSTVLRADAFHVDEVTDGGALVERLASLLLQSGRGRGYDLLVVDIWMPRMDGLQVLAGLQRAGWYPPVVVVTADSAVRERALGLGARAVFEKPFNVDDFRTAAEYYTRAA